MLRRSVFIRNAIALPTYTFYDFETTGLNPVFDQVVRGAFEKTDTDFDAQSSLNIMLRLNPDVIPSPTALVVNRLPISSLLLGNDEYSFMRKVHGIVNTPGTVTVGYNSLSFDDQFLRFNFWRNLLPAYTHQYANQCGRMDIYPMTVAYQLFCPEHLKWTVRKNGKVGFKLEEMNQANQLNKTGRAHDAMSDVFTTVALARRLAAKKEMWNSCLRFFDKKADKQKIENCAEKIRVGDEYYQYGLMISHRSIGKVVTPVLLLGDSVAYPNQTVWLKISDQHALSSPKVFRKKYGEPPFFISLDNAVAEKLIENDANFMRDLKWAFESITNNPAWFAGVRDYYLNFKYEQHDCDVNAKLYVSPFPSTEEEALLREFHEAALENKPAVAEKFSRPEHRELALRLFGRNFPELLSNANKEKFGQYIRGVFSEDAVSVDHTGKARFSVIDARHELEKLSTRELDAEQQDILKDYKQWLSYAGKNKAHLFVAPKAEKTALSDQKEILLRRTQ